MNIQALYKIPRSLLLAFLICYAPQAHSQVAYLWLDIDSEWKTRSTDYWNNAHGYGTRLPAQLINSIDQNYHYAHNNISIKLQRVLKDANIFNSVEHVPNPTNIGPSANDLYIDLVIQVQDISDHYPFFKKELAQFVPSALIRTTIYSGNGDKLKTFEIFKQIDYKAKIKPLLNKRHSDYEKVPEEHKFICIQAFEEAVNELVPAIAKENEIWQQAHKEKNIKGDFAKFQKEMSLLFQERKHKYPQHYSSLIISTQNVNGLAQNRESRSIPESSETFPAYGDQEVANKLSDVMLGVKNYGLFIGVNDYADTKMNDLENPVSDARLLMQTLTSYYTFNKENILLLENATRSDIMKALDHLAATVTAKDNLLIFYAGHGLFDSQLKSGFWLPKDAEHNNRNNWISNSLIRDYIGGIPANHTLLIADACFSGGILKTRDAFSGLTQADMQLYKLTSRKAMTSGTMKTVPDKSVFLDFLVKRLVENDKPFISSEYLFSTFKIAVINNSPNGQVPQFGEIRETGDEGGDFIFMRRKN